jgi:peptidoglycan hydrolase-like protein with peptidoglycan-binding domain
VAVKMDEHDSGRVSVSSVAAALSAAILSAAILYNIATQPVLQQSADSLDMSGPDGGEPTWSTRVSVDAADTRSRTVTLRYDPTVEAVQKELSASGLYVGPVDGVAGKRTQLAIRAYQRRNGLDEEGVATAELVDHIKLMREFAAAASEADTSAPMPDMIRKVQEKLAELGYAPGAINGELGQNTKAAIRRFERDRGIAESGTINGDLIAEIERVAGSGTASAN